MTATSPLTPAAAAMKKAFETGDRSDYVALLASSAITWHNTDNIAAETKRTGTNPIPDMMDEPQVEVIRNVEFAGGELMQFTLRGRNKSTGAPVEAYMCIVFTRTAEGVTRLDEYVDPSLGAKLAAKA